MAMKLTSRLIGFNRLGLRLRNLCIELRTRLYVLWILNP